MKPVKEARDYAEAIVETVREPLIVLDANLRVVSANNSFYKFFHVKKKDTEHNYFYNLGNGQWNYPKLRYLLKDILQKNTYFQDFEIEQVFPKIGKKIVLLNARKIAQKKSNQPTILLAIEDITEKKQLERHKDDFISIASHELKTPITSMKLYAQVLQKHPLITSDQEASDMVSKINLQMNHLSELIASFMNVNNLKNRKLKLHKKTFALDELILEVIEHFQYSTQHHVIKFPKNTKINVFADRNRISQVLINLISNAIKYSPDANEIIIQLNKTKEKATVSVQDFGIGIPKNERSRIYDRFFRAKGKKEGKIPGLGLGLYISSEIIKQHKGELWVESSKGKGSTFYFTLPI